MNRQSWVAVFVAAALCLTFAAPAAAKDPDRPFGGWTVGADYEGDVTLCPPGALIRYGSSGTGEFLHLGRVRVETIQCTWLDVETGTGWFDFGTITLTAANGDTLILAQEGTFQLSPWGSPPPWSSDVDVTDWVVVGGTGRFDGATGSGHGSGHSDGVGPGFSSTTTVSFSGSIAY
jgi:hypothetical protein